jgi:ERCC4-related helicase
LELLREFVAVKRKKALLVAPAQVLDTVWEPKLLEESIKTKNVTLESTGTPNFHPEDFLDFDVVLIDESHNYRNGVTKRYANLMKILLGGRRKQVILMTATPIQNSLLDLYRQLSLITAADDSYFANLGIPDLRRYFIAADRKQLSSGVEDLMRLLDELMIRRTRQFILENYVGVELHGKPIRFPKRNLEKVEYSLTELFGGAVYTQVLETIDKLKLAPYRITSYVATTEEQEKEESELLVSLQKIGLLKRFESSVEAIRKSIDYLIKFYEYFAEALGKGKVLDVKTFRRIMTEMRMHDEEDDESFFRSVEQAELLPLTAEYDRAAIKTDVAADLALLRSLKQNLAKIQPYADRKMTALKEQIVKDNCFENGGKKAIIFTQFVDTAKYLYRELTDSLKKEGREVRLLTGQTDPDTRKRVIESFAPRANPGARFDKEVDLLVSTDILSEGQNLQDCNYVVNYDLPWNPMRIVQRVGRVDRLGSEYETVKSVVFLPEKELEEILKLLEKLEEKIQKAQTIGTEATILGERENPRNFNAVSRIRAQDQSLMDDLERGLELLPIQTPYQSVLTYLKRMGAKSLESVPLGKRSGKRNEDNGVVIFYREKDDPEGMHLLFYSYDTERFEHHNDVTWIFRKVSCNEEEPMWIPFKSAEAFHLFALLDSQAREEIVTAVNLPYDTKTAQKIKPRNQRALAQLLLESFSRGKVSKEQVLPIYDAVNGENLVAWENDFAELLEEYQQQQDIISLLTSVGLLLRKYKIGARERHRLRTLAPSNLEIIGFMFLGNEKLKQRLQFAPIKSA